MSDTRIVELAAIAEEVNGCSKCGLHAGRTKTVPGYGNPHAEIMFIGEAPGFHEDQQGLPFVGKSGQYLDYLLDKIMGIKRDQVFIANVVKCRPPSNRDPESMEIIACRPYLNRQIAIINPLVIATLGRFSMGLFFENGRISKIHGQPMFKDERAYFPFYHPAAALRNPPLRHDMEADMHRLMEVLDKVKSMREGASETPSEPVQAATESETHPQQPEIEVPEDKTDDEPDTPRQLPLF